MNDPGYAFRVWYVSAVRSFKTRPPAFVTAAGAFIYMASLNLHFSAVDRTVAACGLSIQCIGIVAMSSEMLDRRRSQRAAASAEGRRDAR